MSETNQEFQELQETQQEAASMFGAMSAASIVYGIILIIISMLIFMNVKETYVVVTTLLGVYLIVKGVIDFFAVFNTRNPHRGMTLFVSILSFIIGLIVVGSPVFAAAIGTTFILWMIGLTFIISGFMSFKQSVPMAIISIVIGFLMLIFTPESAAVIAWFIALMLLLSGIFTIVFGAATKNVARELRG
jgi:uncharacterized membrane protein HdeD (DUF308 family)